MANKYANLVGANKIKDEYTKINTGFDKVETDINALDSRVDTIITTPIDGEEAAQEIVDARVSAIKSKTFATLDARFEETEQDVESHKADSVTDTDGVHGLKIESGSWTPTVIDSNGGEATYDLQVGSYKIIGPLVYAQFSVGMASKGTIANGNIYIGGLPAVAISKNAADVGVANIDGDAGITFPPNVVKIGSEVRRNTNYIVLRFQKGNGESQLYVTGSNISATARFRGSIIYRRS
jgi:hypothetical protein